MKRILKGAAVLFLSMVIAVPMMSYADEWGQWLDYSDPSVVSYNSTFSEGTSNLMSEDQKRAVRDAIEAFKAEYIKSDMDDFAKEMTIIQWIVDKCDYQLGETEATAYGCLVNGKAKCSGYADAFLETAKACGLEVGYVRSETHAWNLVKLEDDWYHVDVCWEDPTGPPQEYGFGNLWCRYINLTDSEMSYVEHHNTWTPNDVKAIGKKYGRGSAYKYLKNTYDRNDEALAHLLALTPGATVIEFRDVDSAAQEYNAAIDACLGSGKNTFSCILRYPKDMDSMRVMNANFEVRDKVRAHIAETYPGVRMDLQMPLAADLDHRQYCSDSIKIFHDAGSSSASKPKKDYKYKTPTDVQYVYNRGLGASFKVDEAANGGYSLYFEKVNGDYKRMAGTWKEDTKSIRLWDKIFESGTYRFQVQSRNPDNYQETSAMSDWCVYEYTKPSLVLGDVQNIRWANAEQTQLAWDPPANIGQVPADCMESVTYRVMMYEDGDWKKSVFTTNLTYDITSWKEKYNDPNKTYTLTVRAMCRDIERVAHGNEIRFQ